MTEKVPVTSPCSTVSGGGAVTARWIAAPGSGTPTAEAATAVTRAVCRFAATPAATDSATDCANGSVASPTTSSCAGCPDSTESLRPRGSTITASYAPESSAASGSVSTAEKAIPSPPAPVRPCAI